MTPRSLLVIGETLNSSSPAVHSALAAGDRGWVEMCVRRQRGAGVDYLDCHASTFLDQEGEILEWLVQIAETASDLPICIDSIDTDVLQRVAVGRRYPSILNSVDLEGEWPEGILDLVRDSQASLVIQLRKGSHLPEDGPTRLSWMEEALDAADRLSLPRASLLIDAVLMPWGEDLVKGSSVLSFVEAAGVRWPKVRTLVGLSNVSYGLGARARAHRLWLSALKEAGLGAVILGAFDSELMSIAQS